MQDAGAANRNQSSHRHGPHAKLYVDSALAFLADVFASQAAQEIQHLVVSNQQKQDLAHSSNRELSTLTGGTPTVSKVSEEELGESLGDEVGNGGDQKRKKLTKAQVRELEGFWQAGYTGAPCELVCSESCCPRICFWTFDVYKWAWVSCVLKPPFL